MRITTLIFVFCFFISGCASRPPAEPVQEKIAQYTNQRASYSLESRWWTAYNDAQLNELMERAFANNPDYAKTAVRIHRALYQANLAGADLLPTLSGSGSASSTTNSRSGEHATREFKASAGISYELDLWRKLSDTASGKEWEHKATEEDRTTARLALANNVIDSYFTLAYLAGSLESAAKSVANYEKIVQLTTTRYQLGKVSLLEQEQAAQSLLAAQNILLDLEVQQETALQTLRILLNITPDVPLQLEFPDIIQLELPEVDLNVPLSVLSSRPDLKAAEYRLQGAFKDVSAANKAWLPTVTVGASLNSTGDSAGTTFTIPFTAGTITLNLPFLDWSRVYWNVKISEAEYDLLRLDYEEKLITALNEVHSFLIFYQKACRVYANTTMKHKHDTTISQLYKTQYELGTAELSDWLDAQNTALASRLDLLKNRYQIIQQENNIYKAMGGKYRAPREPFQSKLQKSSVLHTIDAFTASQN